ncbi:MAG: LeuA family protein [Lachnospiraceae bacterium]|nr:LeuA family protein [Lachnospiraceae bacterium]
MEEKNKYIYEWNDDCFFDRRIKVHDETLREGIQNLGTDITLKEKKAYIDSISRLPVASICLGYPASSKKIYDEIDLLIPYIQAKKSNISISCAARTTIGDIEPIARLSQKYGCNIKVNAFIGTSQIRQYIEQWDIRHICSLVREAVNYANLNGIETCIITEDSTRTSPEILKTVYLTAIESGCKNICFCDTVGYADCTGIKKLFKFVHKEIIKNNDQILIEWHGHNDRGMALENALIAALIGANMIHTTSFGIGERCGNTPLELFLLNLAVMGDIRMSDSLKMITDHCRKISELFNWQIPNNYPVWGENSFSTVSGIHAAAIYKALDMEGNLGEKVYSFIEPSILGRHQEIKINYMSGKSNILYWMKKNMIKPDDKLVEDILKKAKTSTTPLSDETIWAIING